MDPLSFSGTNASATEREGGESPLSPSEKQSDRNGTTGEAHELDAPPVSAPVAETASLKTAPAEPVRKLPEPRASVAHKAEKARAKKAAAVPETPPAPKPALPLLALFCYEEPGSSVGQYLSKLVQALAKRQTRVHLFSRAPFDFEQPEVTVTAVGAGSADNLQASVEEFTRRVCAAYGQHFPTGPGPAALVGQEWSSIPSLLSLAGHLGKDFHLSLTSLERQRSDMSSDLSRHIAEIEANGLNQARTVLVQEQAVGEVARLWVPECAPRLQLARQPFPTHRFNAKLDPGAIKARYQIGPVDPTILYIGDLNERHGPDILMKSVPAVLKNHRQARFVFVGDGALLWPLRVYTRYLHLEGVVRLVGSVEGQALYDLIQASDMVVVPSRQQTEWWEFQAAWAAGKPVVATHALAAPPLEHDKNCILIYPHESSCVWGIERALYDGKLRQRIAAGGSAKLEERFGWNSVAEQLEGLVGITQTA